MTAPRTVPAAEAEKIKQLCDDGIATMIEAEATEEHMRAALLVRDLAASVVALHAEVERLRALLEVTP